MTMIDDDIITIEIDEPAQLTLEERQGTKGFCVICGDATGDKRRKFCDVHKSSSSGTYKPSNRGGRPNRSAKTATDDQLAGTFGKLLVILTLIFAWSQLRTRHVPDPNGDIADQLGMSDDEAFAIARPIARAFNGTASGMRVGKQIADNSDLIDAVFAGFQWYKRQQQVLDSLGAGRPIEIRKSPRNGRNGSTKESRQDEQGGGLSIVPDLVAAGDDFFI